MDRTQIIFELAQYAHPDWYHSILKWKTEDLNNLLKYYKGEAEMIGADIGFGKDMTVMVTIEFKPKVGEQLKNKMKF